MVSGTVPADDIIVTPEDQISSSQDGHFHFQLRWDRASQTFPLYVVETDGTTYNFTVQIVSSVSEPNATKVFSPESRKISLKREGSLNVGPLDPHFKKRITAPPKPISEHLENELHFNVIQDKRKDRP